LHSTQNPFEHQEFTIWDKKHTKAKQPFFSTKSNYAISLSISLCFCRNHPLLNHLFFFEQIFPTFSTFSTSKAPLFEILGIASFGSSSLLPATPGTSQVIGVFFVGLDGVDLALIEEIED